MASSSSSSSSDSGTEYPHPIYMDHDVNTIPKLEYISVSAWKAHMILYIQGNGLIGFINGTIQPPPKTIINPPPAPGQQQQEMDNPDYIKWKEVDDLVQHFIMSTMQEEFRKQISASLTGMTASQMWDFITKNVHRPPRMTHPDRVSNQEAGRKNITRYLPLYSASVEGDVKRLEEILDKEPSAVRAIITGASETALMVASRKKGNIDFVKKLIGLMSPQDLAMSDSFGQTAICGAAVAGDIEAVNLMVDKNPSLPNTHDIFNAVPFHHAAFAGRKEAVLYLLQVTNEEVLKDRKDLTLRGLISGKFFDICLSFLQRFPTLAVIEPTPLEMLTYRHSAFLSGTHFSFWQRMIYSYLPSELESLKNFCISGNVEIENPDEEVVKGFKKRTTFSPLLWQLAGKFVPQIKRIQEIKVMHIEALQLLRFICSEIAKLDGKRARDLIGGSLAEAAAMGNVEIVEEILTVFPNALYLYNRNMCSLFHIAIVNRKANIFNLIYQITAPRHLILANTDASYNTALHLVAHLAGGSETQASIDLRSCGPGAALQMQRELQWFKEVEKLSWPKDQEARNFLGKTPATVFMEKHEELAKEGEQWMKDRANSGIIIATLIATIVFVSAITVPGGCNSHTGLPLFSGNKAFLIYAVSDALALFMSASSMLMFLGILTARYAVPDFLYSLPRRLITALITLFLSIISMMIAFTAILYLVFGNEKRWVLGLVSSLAAIPVLLFAFLQFNPLLDIITSTYGPGIFGKRSDRILF